MPWKECSAVSQREEFVSLALSGEGSNVSALCRRFGISRKTAYKWLNRFEGLGLAGLLDRSRRPRQSPQKSSPDIEEAVLGVRARHPAWGGRKIRRVLQNRGLEAAPSASTITEILHRHGLIEEADSAKHKPFIRFEHAQPNDLWQMDFKGHFSMEEGRCHPLTVLDDHSRYCIGLQACGNEQGETVKERLTSMFRCYGLPLRMLMDNGSPWGNDAHHPWTLLTVWFLRLGVGVTHGRPYHPQTQGKDERFHRSLQAEVIRYVHFKDLPACQARFDEWRETYNLHRPHEALGMESPVRRYTVSPRSFPETLPAIEYGPDDLVRKVQDHGEIFFRGHRFRVSNAFRGHPVALRPNARDGAYDVFFCHQRLGLVDLHESHARETDKEVT